MIRTTSRGLAAAVVAGVALMLSACSSSSPAASDNTPAPAPTSAPSESTTSAFPLTITHMYGETVIPEQPERVVSVGYREHEWLYALGVAPVAVREWYEGYPYATWPWAEEARIAVGAEPYVFSDAAINFEEVASQNPDVIIATWSGITEEEYKLLSQIAPVVAQSGDYPLYGMPFDEETLLIAESVGKLEEGKAIVAATEKLYSDTVAAHPEWQGKTGAVGFHYEGQPGVYQSADPRVKFLGDLGLKTDMLDHLVNDSFYVGISPENLDLVDFDTVLWLVAGGIGGREGIESAPLFPTLDITKNGGHIWVTDRVIEGAFSFASPLSIAYVFEQLVPRLEAALDGDPATEVPAFEPAS